MFSMRFLDSKNVGMRSLPAAALMAASLLVGVGAPVEAAVITTGVGQTYRVTSLNNVNNVPSVGGDTTSGGREFRGIYGFTISGGTTAAEIAAATSITLTTTVGTLNGAADSDLDFSVIGLTDGNLDFFNTAADRVTAYGAAGTPLQSFTATGLTVGSTITVTLNVTEFVKAQSLAGNPFANFRFEVTNPNTFPDGSTQNIVFGDTADLTLVPEPGSIGLLALSGLCLLSARRRD